MLLLPTCGESHMGKKAMVETFVPACYSRAQSLFELRKMLVAAPRQEAGSKEAFKGYVFEVHSLLSPSVACLSELYKYAGIKELNVRLLDGIVILHRP